MKILLAAVSSSSRPDGVSRHAANVARCLLLHAEVERVDLVAGAWQQESIVSLLGDVDDRLRMSIAQTGRSAWARNKWYWSQLPDLAHRLHSDIVHAAYPVPIRRSAFACPVVVTLHDLYPYDIPANFGFPKVLLNRLILRQCLRSADTVACVSESTLHRLELRAPQSVLSKAVTIYNSVTMAPLMASVSPMPSWRGEPFFLSVGQHRRNKNLILALQVFQSLVVSATVPRNTRLVIVGMDGPETPRIHRFVRRAGLDQSVIFRWCYEHCELLMATSTIEGFGLPVVEAMLHHCRIVCSDIQAFREVGRSYCEYAQPRGDQVKAFVDATRIALTTHKFRAAQTESFSAVRVGQAYLYLYNGLLQSGTLRCPMGKRSQNPALERGRP